MNLTTAFVAAFAVVCACVSGYAVVQIWKADGFAHKPLWIVGCLVVFVGFSVAPRTNGYLILQLGVQIPVVQILWSSTNGLLLKALFPVVAVVALTRLKRSAPDA